MSMNALQALALGALGVASLGYAVKSMFAGVINLGGGRIRDYFVTFANEPGLFVLGVIFMLLLGGGLCLVTWRHFTRGEDQ
jgi:hypothetical protein